jgi:hypothetical protein
MTTQNDILSVREQIQEDLICLLESQYLRVSESEECLEEVKDFACQIVIDNFTKLLS